MRINCPLCRKLNDLKSYTGPKHVHDLNRYGQLLAAYKEQRCKRCNCMVYLFPSAIRVALDNVTGFRARLRDSRSRRIREIGLGEIRRRYPRIELRGKIINRSVLRKIKVWHAIVGRVIPISCKGDTLTLAIDDTRWETKFLNLLMGPRADEFDVLLATEEDIAWALREYYGFHPDGTVGPKRVPYPYAFTLIGPTTEEEETYHRLATDPVDLPPRD